MGAVAAKVDSLLWTRYEITNRLSECDNIRRRKFWLIRIIGFIFIFQMTIMMMGLNLRRTVLYMTHWSAYMVFFTYLMFMMTFVFPSVGRVPFYWKLNHIIFELSFTFGIVVSLVFWIAIGPLTLSMTEEQRRLLLGNNIAIIDYIVNFEIHGVAYVFVFLDMYYNRIEFEWRHFAFTGTLGVMYYIVMCAYTLVSHDTIYPMVTFDNAFSVIFSILAFALGTTSFALGVHLSHGKKRRYDKEHCDSAGFLDTEATRLSIPLANN